MEDEVCEGNQKQPQVAQAMKLVRDWGLVIGEVWMVGLMTVLHLC
jgi:hypothetical protein